MNIALFCDSYKPYISGVTVSVEILAKQLKSLGHTVYVFAPDYPGALDEENVFRFPSLPTFYPGFRIAIPFSPKISRKLKNMDFDIVHCHSPFQLGLLGRRVAKKRGRPFVYTLHTLFDKYVHYAPFIPGPVAKKLMAEHIKRFCASASRVIVPSNYVRDHLLELGVTPRLEVVPTGVDIEAANALTGKGIRKKYGIPEDAVVLMYAGRLTKEKNLPFLLRSFKLINEGNPQTFLMIVAGGPMRSELEGLAKELRIFERVVFCGEVAHPDIFDHFAASDIFVFSSTTETQGLVIAEAFASGLPAVAVKASGVEDTIIDNENGFLVENDINAFKEKVDLLIKDEPLRQKMAENALKHVKERFSALSYAKKVEKIYCECYTELKRRSQ